MTKLEFKEILREVADLSFNFYDYLDILEELDDKQLRELDKVTYMVQDFIEVLKKLSQRDNFN